MKYLYLSLSILILSACGSGDSETENDDKTSSDTTSTVEVIEEPEPTPSELVNGYWIADTDARAKAYQEENGIEMTDEEKAEMAKLFDPIFVEFNENATYEMGGMLNADMNGTGLWEFNEAGDSLTLSLDGAEPMTYWVKEQTDSILQLKWEEVGDSFSKKVNLELKRK